MKSAKLSLLFLIVAAFALAAVAQPRYKERYSTEPGNDVERISVKGKIEKIEGQKALLKTADGREVTIHLGPQRYWHEKGYRLRSGVQATVDGWGDPYADDGGFLFAGAIYGDGFYFELSTSHGYPMWADPGDRWNGWRPSYDCYNYYYSAPPPWHGYWGPPPHWRGHHRPHWRHDPHWRHPPPPRPCPPPRHRR
ncbi:hypothetical protein KJ815_11955 [bacterium]|nr:hypothetical protein [bacterium]